MTQDDPHLTGDGADALAEDSLVRNLYDKVQELDDRVEELEDTNSQLESENEQLKSENETLKKKVTTLEQQQSQLVDDLDDVQSHRDELQEKLNILSSRADALYEEIEQAQSDITDQSFHAEKRLSDIIKRVAGIESELGLEDWETSSHLSPNACALERFASMPDDKRDEELKTPVSRATVVWENFEDWSSPTHKGRVIRSGELRKLLKASTGQKLAWTQLYRVMEEFEENTSEQYVYIGQDGENDAFGKALVRLRDIDDASTEDTTQTTDEVQASNSEPALSW